ncbi:heme biosynthesis protein [Motiliproteus coralliicola]|uniref:Heme biosynthesis protein n=1 Tax=Motiliproteus coralliicola TaxID=2283196 RepID=A0A369WC04_9GAMM|nr:uroporphyrinogen-III C-methyltransferase [Motiliproteus coralliicola]RDE18234.1 heme biosynthesis protein [Motiliproteus coralliicola]
MNNKEPNQKTPDDSDTTEQELNSADSPETPAEDKAEQAEAEQSAEVADAEVQEPSDDSEQSTPEQPVAETASQEPAKAGISKLAVLALLLVLVALGGLGYGYTLLQKMQIQQSEQLASVKEQLGSTNDNNRNTQQQNGQILGELKQLREGSSAQQRNVDELQSRLSKAMQQVSKMGTDTRKDWLLAEVEYLLRLANQRVLMERSSSGALSLLKSADLILKETDDVSIYPIRQALAKDIVALEAVPSLDIDGIYLKLAAISTQVGNLRLLPITDKHQIPEMLKEITPDSVSESWNDGLAKSWANAMDRLGNLIVVRRADEPVKPLLSPEQHYFLTQNLHLMLEQTQLALLQGKQQAFDAGLDKSGNWIKTYFEKTDATSTALVKSLDEIKGTQVAPKMPDISGSLKTLKTYLAELHKLEGAGQ